MCEVTSHMNKSTSQAYIITSHINIITSRVHISPSHGNIIPSQAFIVSRGNKNAADYDVLALNLLSVNK